MPPERVIRAITGIPIPSIGTYGLFTGGCLRRGLSTGTTQPPSLLPPPSRAPVAVIGGSGFVGRAITSMLIESGESDVVSIDLAPSPFADRRVAFVRADIADRRSITAALARDGPVPKFKSVFLVAAVLSYMDRHPHQLEKSMRVNVQGTRNVLDACRSLDIPYIVQTSTSNVCLGADLPPVTNADESTPYTKQPFNHYTYSKILAEQLVLSSNDTQLSTAGRLRTTAIRPASTIFGYRDGTLLDSLVRGHPYFLPTPDAPSDFTHVSNIAFAHLLAMHDLRTSAKSAGRAFFITNDQPVTHAQFLSKLRAHIPVASFPLPAIYPLAFLIDSLKRIPNMSLGELDKLTLATYRITQARYQFSCDLAKQILGYKPLVSQEEGLQRAFGRYSEERVGVFRNSSGKEQRDRL